MSRVPVVRFILGDSHSSLRSVDVIVLICATDWSNGRSNF